MTTTSTRSERNHVLDAAKKRAEKSAAAEARRELKFEQQKQVAEKTAAEAQRRAAEVAQRMAEYERMQQEKREAQMADAENKRELMVSRAKLRRSQVEAEAKAVAAERKAHEERRVEKFAEERKAKEKEHEARSIAKLAKAETARQQKAGALSKRKEELTNVANERQKRVEAHAAKQQAAQLEVVRLGIEKARQIEEALVRVDQREEEETEKIKKEIEANDRVSKKTSMRETLLQQRRAAQTEHSKVVLSARAQVDKDRDRLGRTILQDSERKEQQREVALAEMVKSKMDAAEERKAKYEATLERVQRQNRQKEHERQKLKQVFDDDIRKFHEAKALADKLAQESKAAKERVAADRATGKAKTMREITEANEPRPTTYDNRFYSMGELGPGGKFGRVGHMKSAPAFSLGKLPANVDMSIGKTSPGPQSAKPELGSREILDKTSQYKRAPAFSIGHRVPDLANKEAMSKPGPGETHASDKQLSLTRYASAPTFSFGSAKYNELEKQRKVAEMKLAQSGGTPARPSTSAPEHVSWSHPSRMPGPATYDLSRVQTSLRSHRRLADGVGVSQRFGKSDRFIQLDAKGLAKDPTGPTTYTKMNSKAPGPQRYHPSTSYLSTPLAF